MRRETWSISFACALGAFIGTLVALEIAARFTYGSWFWSAGALIGGLVAYCAVDFHHICTGIACSYRKTINWRPDYAWWKAYVICFGGFYTICISGTILTEIAIVPNGSIIIPLVVFAVVSAIMAWVPLVNCPMDEGERRSDSLQMATNLGWSGMRNYNPIAVMYWVFWATWWVIRRIPPTATTMAHATKREMKLLATKIKQFVVRAFICVHSERRKLCFVDATLGATAGFFLGSAIFGALIGAILGLINYEVVSVRWLKIVPTKAK